MAGRGLAGYYFAGSDFAQVKLRREDAQVVFDWQSGSPHASIPAGADGFGVRWSGRVMPKYSETYNFYTRTTGGVRLWVDGKLIIDDRSTHPLKDNKGSLWLAAGKRYDVRVEYFDTGAEPSRFELHWSSRRQRREVVPTSRLFASEFDTTPPSAPGGLKATYVTDTALKFVWRPATDDSGTVVYDTYIGRTRMGATTETSWTRGGRNPQMSYALTVRAVDFAGNVSVSLPLIVTTLPPPPSGSGVGLAGTYFDAYDFNGLRLTRTDAQVLFGWNDTPFEGGAGGDAFSARWEGTLLARYDELYNFYLLSDGAARLWVGGRLLIDGADAQSPRELVGSMKLVAGRQYSVKVEYQHGGPGQAMIGASWSSLSTRKQALPVTQLAPKFVDSAAPTAPANLVVDDAGETSVSIHWDASSDDVGVVYYDVYRNGQKVGSTSNLNYTDEGLSPDTAYSYTVTAVDAASHPSAASGAAAARTLVPPPPPPVVGDAFVTIPAIGYGASSGVTRAGNAITSLDDGDWVRYRIDFGAGGGANSWRVKLGSPVSTIDGTIELRLGSPDGQLIGTHVVQPTGSYGTRYTQRVGVNNVTGVHDVYLVFRGRSNMANLESFQFNAQRLVRVMPLGDSITDGQPPYNSYRYYLYRKLIDAGYGVDFVGSRIQNKDGSPPDFDFDQNHEGHSGIRADQMLEPISPGSPVTRVAAWVQATNPDVVLLHLGTNDLWRGDSRASTVAEISQIIDVIRGINPSIKIVLAKLIPLANYEGQIAEFNSELAVMAAGKGLPGSPLVLADMHSGFSLSEHTYDNVHPNAAGAGIMADRWFDAVDELLA